MPETRYRSRTLRRVAVTTPGGRRITHYERRRPSAARCANIGCNALLKGVPRGTPSQVRKLSKTQRRPERPYGGSLCTRCMRKEMISKARVPE